MTTDLTAAMEDELSALRNQNRLLQDSVVALLKEKNRLRDALAEAR